MIFIYLSINLTKHQDKNTPDEIGQLAKVFNNMTLRLQNSHNKLETLIAERASELSHRVKEIELQKIGIQNLATDLDISQQRYEHLVNSIDGIVWEANPKTLQFLFVNKQAECFTGYPTGTWLNQINFLNNHIHPDDRGWVTAYSMDAIKNGQDYSFECRMLTIDEKIIWLKNLATVVVENGQPVKLFGIMFDITEQKKAEEEIAIFKQFMDASGEGMSMATLDRNIIYMNPSLKKFLEIPEQSIVEKDFFNYYPAELQQRLYNEVMPSVMQTGQWSGEMKLVSTKGKVINTFENLFLLKDKNGKSLHIASVINNITQYKQAEQRLRYTEEQLYKMFEEGPIGMVIVNSKLIFSKANPAFCKMLGYTEEELFKLTITDI